MGVPHLSGLLVNYNGIGYSIAHPEINQAKAFSACIISCQGQFQSTAILGRYGNPLRFVHYLIGSIF